MVGSDNSVPYTRSESHTLRRTSEAARVDRNRPGVQTRSDMSDSASEEEVAYHLSVEPDEASIAAVALNLLISDEAHQPQIRGLAREVLRKLAAEPGEGGAVLLALSAGELKITHTAVRLLLDDLGREQDAERQILWRVLEKMPDEHAIRAIELE